MKTHDAAALFPLLGGEEFAALKRDIAEHGQREPVLVVGGVVVDGRNRLRACKELGVEPMVRSLTAKEAGDVHALVMSLNYHRRHLEAHEKGAALAAYMERVGAKKRAGPGRPKKSTEPVDSPTIAAVAKKLGVPEQTARDQLKAAADYKAAAPELRAKVDAGEITPRQAAAVTAKVQRVVPTMSKQDREDDAKIAAVYDKHAAEHREQLALLRWLRDTADDAEHWAPIFLRRKWDRATLDGVRANIARIHVSLKAMSRRSRQRREGQP